VPRTLPRVQECFGRVAAAMVAARVSMPRVLAWADWSSTRNRMTPTRMCRQVRRCAQLSTEKLSLFSEHWSPKVVARLNEYEIKVVKVKGEFVWHTHDDTDELFLVVAGELSIQLRDGA